MFRSLPILMLLVGCQSCDQAKPSGNPHAPPELSAPTESVGLPSEDIPRIQPPVAAETGVRSSLGTLAVKVRGIRNRTGKVLVSLYNQAEGFPNDYEKAFRSAALPIEAESVSVNFDNLPFGTYAISVCHDEDGDQAVRKNFLGIPKEGVIVTGKLRYGPPRFQESAFELDEPVVEKMLEIRYF